MQGALEEAAAEFSATHNKLAYQAAFIRQTGLQVMHHTRAACMNGAGAQTIPDIWLRQCMSTGANNPHTVIERVVAFSRSLLYVPEAIYHDLSASQAPLTLDDLAVRRTIPHYD